MLINEIINVDFIRIIEDSISKDEVLDTIARISSEKINKKNVSQEVIKKALSDREKVGSTGFGNQIAIPHCKLKNIDEFIIGIVVVKKGVDFNAADGKKVKLFFFIVSPDEEYNKHIRILSSISKLLQNEDAKQEIIDAKSPNSIMEVINRQTIFDKIDSNQGKKVMFHVIVQDEKYFTRILQIFSEKIDGAVTVIETQSAMKYLYSMPIFSTFWNEEEQHYNRIIIAIADNNISNNIIRQLNTVVPDIESKSGVLFTVQEILYSNGRVEF